MDRLKTKRSLTSMGTKLPKINERIEIIKDKHAASILKTTKDYLTEVALRHIVEYIIELEEKVCQDNRQDSHRGG